MKLPDLVTPFDLQAAPLLFEMVCEKKNLHVSLGRCDAS
jgi:hypothetical protein